MDARNVVDARSWPATASHLLGQKQRCQLRGLPHGRFAWAARLHDGVRTVYETIHGTDALVSSCDNSFFTPLADAEQTSNRSWPHVDQNVHDARFTDDMGVPVGEWEVYQGLVYVWSSDTACASTTVLWCGSHTDVYNELMADRYMMKRGAKGNHFGQLKDVHAAPTLFEGWHKEARRVPVPAGSLLLWSSKTVHQGWIGGPRLSQPVCWEPVGRRPEAARERKLRLAALGLPSTHSASIGLPHTLVAPQLCEETNAGNDQLALKATIQPVTLAAGVDIMSMWRALRDADWNRPLPAHLRSLLERSIDAKYVSVL